MATIMENRIIETEIPREIIIKVPVDVLSVIKTDIRKLLFKKGRRSIHPNEIIKVIDTLQYALDNLIMVDKINLLQAMCHITHDNYQAALSEILKMDYLDEPDLFD